MANSRSTSQINIESSGRFGTAFHAALIDKDLSLTEFARLIDANYEFLRKILRGEVFPSKRMLEAIIKPLHLNQKKMETLIAQDRMEKKVGKTAFGAAIGRHERASEFDAILPHLHDSQISQIIAQMKAMMQYNDRGKK